ncbi:MAG: LamG-like jellyroll fold domain-containing protein [Sedimentisphaeraceae bacterium JB056]
MYRFLLVISIIMVSISMPVAATTLSYYMFEEGVDGNGAVGTVPETDDWVLDSINSDNNGTVVLSLSSPEYSTESSVSAPGSTSLRFSTEGGYVLVGNSSIYQFSENTSRTVEFFVCRSGNGFDPSSTEFVMSKDYGTTNGWDMYFNRNTGLLNFRIRNHIISSVTDFTDGGWHHVAVTHAANSATYELFVDYRKEAELSGYGSGSVSEGPLYIGSGYGWQSLRSFNGYIDEVRFSDTALSTFEFLKVEIETASFPKPGNTTVVSGLTPTLEWIAGSSAVTHSVYFGTSADSLAYQTETSSLSWTTPVLKPATTYYWRIDAVNSSSQDSPWTGDVWSFTTSDYVVLEDFESYADEAALETSWTISQDDPNNLQSSDLASIDEDVYNDGERGLKMVYDLASASDTSIASFVPSYTNWQDNGIKSMSIYVLAPVSNDSVDVEVELSDGTNSSAVTYSGFADITDGLWNEMNIDLSLYNGVDLTNIQNISLIATGNAGTGTIYIDDIRVYVRRPMGEQEGDLTGDYMVTLDDFALMASQWNQDNIWP